MGSIYRKQFTKPLPANAEIIVRKGQRQARWRDRHGRLQVAPITQGTGGSDRVAFTSDTYVCKYRDGGGQTIIESTGCKDEMAARRYLAEKERRAELVRSGVISSSEDSAGDYMMMPLSEHLDAYDEHLAAKEATVKHRRQVRSYVERVADDCGWRTLADLRREDLERWLTVRRAALSAKTRNHYRGDLVAFANWCCAAGRLQSNPFRHTPKANERVDRRRQRRALTVAELAALLIAARERPLQEAMTVRKGPRAGERYADIRPSVRARLERLGGERAMIYRVLVMTGLRKGELASITVGQVRLYETPPYIDLEAKSEKNRQGSRIPLRGDLADDLRRWIEDQQLPDSAKLFRMPSAIDKILTRDLAAAGVSKRDDRGHTVDVHALRHTFISWLSAAGVAPRTAQAAARHGSINLTLQTYTDPRMLDVAAALDALPVLPPANSTAEAAAQNDGVRHH